MDELQTTKHQEEICSRKVYYNSRADAELSCQLMNLKQFAYRCDVCGKYHLTKRLWKAP